MQVLHGQRVLAVQLRELGLEVREDERVDVLRRLVRHEPDRELAGHLGGDDRLRACRAERALDAVQRERRVAHPAHQHLGLVRRERDGRADGTLDVVDPVVERLVARAVLGRNGLHEVLDAWDEDLAGGGDEFGHEGDEVRHGLVDHAAEYARVEVPRGAGDGDFVVGDAAEAVGEAGRTGVEPVVVGLEDGSITGKGGKEEMGTHDADTVDALEPLAGANLALDKVVETFGATLLHALEAEAQVDGEVDAEFLMRLKDVHPAKYGALVVARSTTNQTTGLVVDDEREWLGVPPVALCGL